MKLPLSKAVTSVSSALVDSLMTLKQHFTSYILQRAFTPYKQSFLFVPTKFFIKGNCFRKVFLSLTFVVTFLFLLHTRTQFNYFSCEAIMNHGHFHQQLEKVIQLYNPKKQASDTFFWQVRVPLLLGKGARLDCCKNVLQDPS